MLATQMNAWNEIQPTIADAQQEVLKAIRHSEDGMTLFELVKALGWPVNRISGRVTELHSKELIMMSGTRVNPDTGKSGTVWKAKDM